MKNKFFARILSLVTAAVLVLSGLPAAGRPVLAAENENLVYNGSFDLPYSNAQTVSGWSLNTKNTNHTAVIQSSVVYGDSGNALKIDATGQSYIYAMDFSVEAGATYILSYYIRVEQAQSLQYAPFMNDSNYAGGWWKDFVLPAVTEANGEWVKVSGSITIPESVWANANNPQSKIQLGFKVYQGSGLFYLDSVSVTKSPINSDTPNLDFELQASDGGVANWQSTAQNMVLQGDSSVYHSGSRSMYIRKTSLNERDYVDSLAHIPVQTGNVYEFSFWMCSRNAQPTATVRLNLQPFAADGTKLMQDGQEAVVYGSVAALNGGSQRSGWTKVTTRAALPEGTKYVTLRFLLTRGAAEVWIDDLFFQPVEDGTDCVVYYEDFHATDESGNISTWKQQGSGSFTAENGGKLALTSGEGFIYTGLTCLMTDYTYCIKGDYTADIGGTVQVRFYDYQRKEYLQQRKTAAILAGNTSFALTFTAPSHTYAEIYIGSDQSGTITVSDVTVYMTAQKPKPNRNYLDADWSKKADRENVVSSVEVYNGIPTLMIDGQPTSAYFYQRPDLDAYLQTNAESRIAESGIELFVTYGGNLYKGGCDPIWLEDGSIDYAAFDAVIYDTLAADENALVMVNIGMFAPGWWLEQNPDYRAQAHNGSSYIALDDVSLASEKFRREAGEVLRQLIVHMKEQNYYNRVFGLKISGGQSYEWMHLGTGADQGPDYSAVSQEGFRTYLKNKYGTDAALQAAWGNNTVTLATAAAPGWEEKCAYSNVFVGDVETGSLSRNIVDWNLWLGEASADSFLYYCQIAKEETDGQIIVGGYNGYLWTSNTHDSQGKAHTAMDRVLDSEYVDWIASPIAYSERLLGQSSAYMALLDSVQAHGKLYIAEQDNRTCLSDRYAGVSWDADWDYKIGQTRTMADTIYQQKRDFANALVNGAGLWQFDMYGGWLDDEQIYDYIRAAKTEYDLSVHLDRNTTNEIAVFVGDETYGYLTAENSNMSYTLLEPMLMQQRKHLASMGAGYDTYAMSSLLDGKVPGHKLNIILSPFEITEQMHNAIDTYLKINDQVVVWVYLPGISDGTALSLANVQRATGFSIGAVEQRSTLQVQLADSGHSLTEGIAGLIYGNSVVNSVSPLTYIQDTAGATVLGYNTAGQKPGLAVKDMGDWTSVYSSAPCLDAQLLRNLMAFAGCHSYCENPADIIYSSNSYVALHSGAEGTKTITLPGNYSVYDVFEEKMLSMNTDQIQYEHQANDTHIFRLMKPNTYAVTAVVQSGKGTLSVPGLTQVAAGQSYTLKVIPESGYEVDAVTVNGVPTALDGNHILQISSVNKNTTIKVRFVKQNTSDNWGFEWGSFGGGVTGSGAATIVSDENVHSGTYSLRLNHDGTARDLVQISIYMDAAAQDRTLHLSYWAKVAPGAVRALHSGVHFFTANWTTTQKSSYSAVYPSRTQWQQYTQELTLPAGTEIVQYQLYADTANADIYVDDISVTCDGQQMMINGSLERGNLTGSFDKFENTPQVVHSQLAHSGVYAAKITGSGVVTAQMDLQTEEDQRLALSAWVQGAAKYRILQNGTTLSEGSWTGGAQWSQQTAQCIVPAGTDAVQIEIYPASTTSTVYLDDMELSIVPPPTTGLRFQEIYSDGTWRFVAENPELLTESYYKIPVTVDGQASFVIAHNSEEMLCIYPDFFRVYGGAVPVACLTVPENAVLKAVDPSLNWGEKTDSTQVKIGKELTVTLAEGRVEEWNLTLGGDLTVNFHTTLQVQDLSKAQAVITVGDQTYSFEDVQEQNCFSIPMAAAEMTDEICVQLFYSGVTVWEERYTIRQYADYVLADESMTRYHPMVRQMLHYGGAAQVYFDYGADRLANVGILNADQQEIPTSTEQGMTVTGSVENVRFYGASLLFQNKVAVQYYFSVSDDLESLTFTANGIAYEPVSKNGLYCVELPGVNPQDWDAQQVLTVTDENGNTLTVGYSPMHYIVRMNKKGNDTLKSLLKAMYNYHLTAETICAE